MSRQFCVCHRRGRSNHTLGRHQRSFDAKLQLCFGSPVELLVDRRVLRVEGHPASSAVGIALELDICSLRVRSCLMVRFVFSLFFLFFPVLVYPPSLFVPSRNGQHCHSPLHLQEWEMDDVWVPNPGPKDIPNGEPNSPAGRRPQRHPQRPEGEPVQGNHPRS